MPFFDPDPETLNQLIPNLKDAKPEVLRQLKWWADRQAAYEFLHSSPGGGGFLERAWAILEPATDFKQNWHHGVICEHLQAVLAGDILRLIINIPPRSLKSYIATICWPVWCWLHQPSLRFMFASYSAGLSEEHSVKRRVLIRSNWFQYHFGDLFQLLPDQDQKSEFSNDKQGSMIATSVMGTSVGKGGEILVLDDPMSPQQAKSEVERAASNAWIQQSFLNRLNDKKTGRIVCIMQRLHEDDTTGMLREAWGDELVHLKLPAIAPERTVITLPISRKEVVREEGDLLHPDREGERELAEMRRGMGSYIFSGQYQQDPAPADGGLFKRWWWRFWYPADTIAPDHIRVQMETGEWVTCLQMPLPTAFDMTLQSWDCAFKGGEKSDWVVGQAWGRKAADMFLFGQERAKADMPKTLEMVQALTRRYPFINMKLIEDKANGSAVIAMLQKKIPGIQPVQPEGGKESRAAALCPLCESGNIYLPHPALYPWVTDLLDEFSVFPRGRHDDQVDAATQATTKLLKHYYEWGTVFSADERMSEEERANKEWADNINKLLGKPTKPTRRGRW